MKKLLIVMLGVVLLSGVGLAANTAQFTLGITPLEAIAITINPTSLSFSVPLGVSTELCGTPTNPEAGLQPCPTITNSGVQTWTLALNFHDDGVFSYLNNWVVNNQNEVTLGLAVSGTGSIQECWPKIEDTTHTSPWGTVATEGVNVTSGSSVRLWLKFKVSSNCTVVGTPQTVVLTFSCVT